jgi:hypothetical protein
MKKPAPPTYDDYLRSFTYELDRLPPETIEVILLAVILAGTDNNNFTVSAHREFTRRGFTTDLF